MSKLSLLELSHVVIGNNLMDYISKYCPLLKDLSISHSVQEKPKRSAFIVIRLPEHKLKSIKLNSLHLNPGGQQNKCNTNISILSFYESTRYSRQMNRRKKNTTQTPEMWRFYHVHKSISKYQKQLRRLNTEEAAQIANYESNEKKWKHLRNSPIRKSYLEPSQWTKDIQFGAVLLLCKSVDLLLFNELKVK
jgi:hypothetical protein